MHIKRIALKNFKCFKEVAVDFSRITLLTGENSSGKSSLIYGILAPLQSVNFNWNSFPLYLALNGEYVNMGGFEEASFNHNLKDYIGIELITFFDGDINYVNTIWYFDASSKSSKLNYAKIKNRFTKTEIKEEKSYYNVNSTPSEIDYLYPQIKDARFENLDVLSTYDNGSFYFNIFQGLYHSLGNQFNFISSFRLHPERTYYQSLVNNKIDKFGSGYIDQILDWSDRKSAELYELASILKNLGIVYDIKPHRLSGGRFEIKVKTKSRSKWDSLADVGFGISQFLPIIVADLQLSDESTLIMSQPEIHLHPSVQANLGNYLVKQVKEKEKSYIVETHSEYLLNRMRLLIVQEEIQPEDVAVYYFENSIKNGSVAHRIEFTKQGQILNAPKGFFDTYMIDTMDIALNA